MGSVYIKSLGREGKRDYNYRTVQSRLPLLIVCAALGLPSAAQTPSAESRSRALQTLEQDARRDAVNEKTAKAAAAETLRHEMQSKLADFANAWNKLVMTVEKGGWNAKQARKTRECFERLVRTSGWIEDRARENEGK